MLISLFLRYKFNYRLNDIQCWYKYIKNEHYRNMMKIIVDLDDFCIIRLGTYAILQLFTWHAIV